jgi:nucleotide-binding universal stress UspA family protein
MQKHHTSSRRLSRELQPHEGRPNDGPTHGGQYAHILVPTSLAATDGPALRLGLEMAAIHRSKLTLLHIVPAVASDPSAHWLDAIDRLYSALDRSNGREASQDGLDTADLAQLRLREYLEREVPAHLRQGVRVHAVSSLGSIGDTIAKSAEDVGADLVIMSTGKPRWWLSVLPEGARELLRLKRKHVIFVRPGAPGH